MTALPTVAAVLALCADGEGDCLLWRGPFDGSAPRPVVFLGHDAAGRQRRLNPRTVLLGVAPGVRTTFTCGDYRCMRHIKIVRGQSQLMRVHVRAKTPDQRARIAAGRRRSAACVLDLDRARAIRADRAAGQSQRAVAASYGISRRMVQLIEQHRVWREPSPFRV